MEFAFNDDQEALRASARDVLTSRSTSAVIRKAMKSKTGTDAALWTTIGELGWPGVAIAEEHGGLGLGLAELCILMEEMGRAVAPVPFYSTVCLAAQVVEQTEPSEARASFLAAVASGERRATLALGDGSFDPASVKVKAVLGEDGSWTFSGTALLASEAHLADDIVVVARTERTGRARPQDGLSLFVVPSSALKSTPKARPSLDGTRRLADVRLGGVTVPAGALLGTQGAAWPAITRGLDRAAVLLAAEGVGVASAVLDRSVAYVRERTQFDRPIGSFQAISHRCADMLLWTETARSNVYYAAWALEEGTPDAHLAAATAKAAASDAARIVASAGIQVHGGIGFTWEHDMHLFYRRAKFCEIFLGDAGLWRERIIAELAS